MTFRARVILAAAVAVAVAVALGSTVAYFAARSSLRGEVDDALRARSILVQQIAALPLACIKVGGQPFERPPNPQFGGPPAAIQVICERAGTVRPPGEDVPLPVSDRARRVASGEEKSFFSDEHVSGVHIRMLTLRVGETPAPKAAGVALQVARPLDEVDQVLDRLRLIMIAIGLSGIGLAAGLGLLVAGAALRPVRRLTDAAEEVGRTRNLGLRVEAKGDDELSRLGATFNAMLAALDESVGAQRRLVIDASHELRTPLTSLRTNIEVLARADQLDPAERERLRQDVLQQIEELSLLITDVVDLARGDEPAAEPEDVRLDLLVEDVVERASRNAPRVHFATDLRPCTVRGVPRRLERAVANLLDNAVKWSPEGAQVLVSVNGGEVMVRDEGPGFSAEDLPHVFDRFYRSTAARGKPGSGLGLAIVRQVATSHGGEVVAERAQGGGTRLRLRLEPNGRGVKGS
jgi:two-component system, OmpR family, sensor histidine kinase MprB